MIDNGDAPKLPSADDLGQMSKTRKRSIYAIAVGTWLTGSLWLVFHYFLTQPDEFGFEGPHPLEKWWLIGHALFALWAIWIFGVLWPGHIKSGWSGGISRISGGSLFGVILWLTLSGFLLYYLGNANWRSWTSLAHWIVGEAALIVFIIHLPRRKRS